ncbi:hypothetical protein C8R47DRAFT_1200311 [Mycena vitilis]|nr:hypothetical protein C8R47DRAFT_1200311 [Mycena vitilis]
MPSDRNFEGKGRAGCSRKRRMRLPPAGASGRGSVLCNGKERKAAVKRRIGEETGSRVHEAGRRTQGRERAINAESGGQKLTHRPLLPLHLLIDKRQQRKRLVLRERVGRQMNEGGRGLGEEVRARGDGEARCDCWNWGGRMASAEEDEEGGRVACGARVRKRRRGGAGSRRAGRLLRGWSAFAVVVGSEQGGRGGGQEGEGGRTREAEKAEGGITLASDVHRTNIAPFTDLELKSSTRTFEHLPHAVSGRDVNMDFAVPIFRGKQGIHYTIDYVT